MDPTSILPYLGVIISVVMFVILGVVALIVFFVFRKSGVLTQLGRALDAGSSMPGQSEVERNGRIGEATVLDRNDLETVAKNRTMIYHMGALVLEVRLPGFAPYRAPCRQWFIGSKWSRVSQGDVVPVRVDVHNPQIVFVDLTAIDQRREAAEIAEREAHARRQAELLGVNRR